MATAQSKTYLEKHYTPVQLSKLWGISDDSVRDLFRGEEGVRVIERPETMHKRAYSSMLIPESVVERVYNTRLVAKHSPAVAANHKGFLKLEKGA